MKKFISLFVLLSILLWNISLANAINECKINEINKYDRVAHSVYSRDGKNFVFVAKKDGKWIIVKEDCGNWNSSTINNENENQTNNLSIKNNSIKKENNKIYSKLDSKLEILYNKISQKSLIARFDIYKKIRNKLKLLQWKYKSWKNKELIGYLYFNIDKKYKTIFKEYVLFKRKK